MTQLSVATASNPSHLPPRYEIRRLTEKEIPWIAAIIIHSNLFHGTIWNKTYPENLTKRNYECYQAADYLVRHQVESGHSFGIFDLEYQYRTTEAQAVGGKLLWDLTANEMTGEQLLEQMDFPLVSIAMAYDGNNAFDMEKLMPLIGTLPAFGTIYHTLEVLDTRDPESWKPTGPHQVLLRNATATRHEYEGKGFMRKLAEWLMRYAADIGFRGVQIECIADKVTEVWSKPPQPFKGIVVSEFNTWEYEEDEEVDGQKTGKKVNVFEGPPPKREVGRQRIVKVYVELKPGAVVDGNAG